MFDSIKRAAKSVFKLTGLDIVKVRTFEALLDTVAAQRRQLEELAQEQERRLAAYRSEPSIIPLRPDCYRYLKNDKNEDVLVFTVQDRADFDWLEEAILRYGYYEKPNVWSLTVNADTRVLAAMISSLGPASLLDLGCANGTLLQALDDLGIAGEGVEISSYALEHAFPAVRDRIHHGDLLALPQRRSHFDVVSGLDIFEHLNPNRIDAYVERVREHLKPGGFLLANVPAFGTDEVFGEIFEYYLTEWKTDLRHEAPFNTIHVDMHGYPMNGHLIWADTRWWTGLFERHGFRRDTERETALHRDYDDRLFYARRSFYVFQKLP